MISVCLLLAVLALYRISAHYCSFSQNVPYTVESLFSFLLLHWMFCTTVGMLTTYCHEFLQYLFIILFQLHFSADKWLLDLYS